MKSKIAVMLTTMAFLISLVLEMQYPDVCRANPVPYPPAPNTDLPNLQIQQPQNYSTTYATNTFDLDFKITTPNSWNSYGMFGIPAIGDYWVYVYLDGTENYSAYNAGTIDQFISNYTVTLGNLTANQHTVTIEISARTFYVNTSPSANYSLAYNDYRSNITQTIIFQINAESRTILFTEQPSVIVREPYPSQSPSQSPMTTSSPVDNSTITSSPSPVPSIPELSSWILLPLLIAVIGFAAVLRRSWLTSKNGKTMREVKKSKK